MIQPPIQYRRIKIAAAMAALAAFAWVLAGWSAPAAALQAPTIMKVEETWELVVASADPTSGGPQLCTVMSPYAHVGAYYGIFSINYRELPDIAEGGLQTAMWNGSTNLDYGIPLTQPLHTAGDTITWIQYLDLNSNGDLRFHVHNGSSLTWGSFGGGGFCADLYSTTVTNLNGYTPDISVAYARRWGLERDRVTSLSITHIRKWDQAGALVFDDSTIIQVLPL